VLDLETLIADMHGLAGEVVRSAEETVRQRERALAQLRTAAGLPHLRESVRKFEQDMALPAAGRDMGAVVPPPAVEDYAVIATDGSQIPPDYHHIAPWYVINAGCAVLRYGEAALRGRCSLGSEPKLLPPRRGMPREEVPFDAERDGSPDAAASAVGAPGPVEVERLLAELKLGKRLVEQEADCGAAVLLLDGPLVQWRMIADLRSGRDRERVVGAFQELLAAGHATRTPVAGFISRSRAVEWVTLLRYSMCEEVMAGGSLCAECNRTLLKRSRYDEPPPDAHHAPLAGLRDAQLAGGLLQDAPPGARTEVVELQSKVWETVTGGGDAAGFFYVKTEEARNGGEVARVELPAWVWNDRDLMERLHGVVWDQCEAGRGYPMALAEAHEQAVVRHADRQTFYAVIERILSAGGLPGPTGSAKAASKRRPMA
jgi:hypothetical protein